MRLLLHTRWLLALVLGLGSLLTAQATHLRGGNITYSSVASTTAGVPRYHVVVQLFLDSRGPEQSTIELAATNGNYGSSSFTVQATKPLLKHQRHLATQL